MCVCLHRGLSPAEAELRYLMNANKLSLYGVDLHVAKVSQRYVGLYFISFSISDVIWRASLKREWSWFLFLSHCLDMVSAVFQCFFGNLKKFLHLGESTCLEQLNMYDVSTYIYSDH